MLSLAAVTERVYILQLKTGFRTLCQVGSDFGIVGNAVPQGKELGVFLEFIVVVESFKSAVEDDVGTRDLKVNTDTGMSLDA